MAESNMTETFSTWTEIERQKEVVQKDLSLISDFDFDTYRHPTFDDRPEDGRKYGMTVLRGEEFYDDINFALLDIAWRVRLEDATGKHDLRDKVLEIVKNNGKRFGFVFACTFLKAVYTLEETNWGLGVESELKARQETSDMSVDDDNKKDEVAGMLGSFSAIIPSELKSSIKSQILGEDYDFNEKPDRKLTDGLRSALTDLIVGYVESLVVKADSVNYVLEDFKALGEIVRIMFSDVYMSYENEEVVQSIRKNGKSVGDSYLVLDQAEKIYKSIFAFREENKKVISDVSTELEVILDNILEDADHYESLGLNIKKTPSEADGV